jgi:hypothetical protein
MPGKEKFLPDTPPHHRPGGGGDVPEEDTIPEDLDEEDEEIVTR